MKNITQIYEEYFTILYIVLIVPLRFFLSQSHIYLKLNQFTVYIPSGMSLATQYRSLTNRYRLICFCQHVILEK